MTVALAMADPDDEEPAGPPALIEIIDPAAYEALPPEDKAIIDGALAELKQLQEQNPLNGYFPYPKQKRFHLAKERTRAFIGGSRTGKTTCSSADDLIQALPPELVPDHLMAYKKFGFDKTFKGRVITPDLAHTMEVVLEKYRQLVPQAALRGGKWDKAFDKQSRILHFARGDTIDFMSTEQHPNKFGGVDLDRIHFDEEPAGPNSWAIYRDCDTRLLDRGGDMLFSMTPLLETDWVETEVWDKRDDPDHFAVRASMLDNPHLDPKRVAQLLLKLTKEERNAIEHGEFVSFAGKFYDEFDEDVHVIDPLTADLLEACKVVVGIDPGSRTGVVWVAFDKDNSAVVFDEFFPDGMVTPDVAKEIHARNEMWGIKPLYVIDPAARIRTGPSQEQFTTEFARHRIYCASGQNARGPGIMEVKRRLQEDPPAIRFTRNCKQVLYQMPRYKRDPNKEDEWEAARQSATLRFDLLDAVRYAVMERTWHKPKVAVHRKRHDNWNPMVEPPWTGQTPSEAPPLGSMS